MNKKEQITVVTSAIFTAVAFMHLLRVVTGTSLSIGGVEISMWMSIFAFIAIGLLAILNFKMISNKTGAHWAMYFMWLFVIDGGIVFYSWIADISYWGIPNAWFAWFTLFDLIVALLLVKRAKKLSQKTG